MPDRVPRHGTLNKPDDLVLVHSSDLHLTADLPLAQHQGDHLDPLRQVLRAATVRPEADGLPRVLVLAGDVFEHNRLPLAFLERAARLLAEASLPIVILPGNHDPLTPDSVYRRGGLAELANVFVIGLSVDEAVLFPELDLEIWGRAHRDYADMAPLECPRPRTTRWQMALAHGHYVPGPPAGQRFHASWLIHDHELAATGADYVALGHWNRSARVGSGSVPAYYSGSPDLAQTVNVVRLASDGSVQVARQPLRLGTQQLSEAS